MKYYKVKGITSKLRELSRVGGILYITGSLGMGKTAAVQSWMKNRSCLFLDGKDGSLSKLPPIEAIDQEYVVVDDLAPVNDVRSEEYVLELVEKAAKDELKLILISRGDVPAWLVSSYVRHDVKRADNMDLYLTDEDIVELFADYEHVITADSDDFNNLVEDRCRNTLLLILIARTMRREEVYGRGSLEAARRMLFIYMDQNFYDYMDDRMQRALLMLCGFATFHVKKAALITAASHIREEIELMFTVGDFVTKVDEERYRFDHFYDAYLQWKQQITYTKHQINDIQERAALYYEMHDQLLEALECYRKAENMDMLTALLCRIVTENPGLEQYIDVLKYYEAIPTETISKIPALMYGMSLIHSLWMNPVQAESWYNRLKDFAQNARRGTAEQREAIGWKMMLDIILPHRSLNHFAETVEKALQATGIK